MPTQAVEKSLKLDFLVRCSFLFDVAELLFLAFGTSVGKEIDRIWKGVVKGWGSGRNERGKVNLCGFVEYEKGFGRGCFGMRRAIDYG